MRSCVTAFSCVLLALMATRPAVADPPCFRALDQVPPFGEVEIIAMSSDGCIILGRSGSGSYFRWERGVLGREPSGVPRGMSADGRVVVGAGNSLCDIDGAVRWSARVGLLPLNETGNPRVANAVSADGLIVVGSSGPFPGEGLSYRHHPVDGVRWLTNLADSEATGISDDGRVVVGRSTANGNQVFRWTAETGTEWLGFVSQADAYAAPSVSADGQVIVGRWQIAIGSEPFRWTEATGPIWLGSLQAEPDGGGAIAASGNGSTVVGWSKVDGQPVAFVWDAGQEMRNLRNVLADNYGLNLVDWTLLFAQALSSDGRTIAGGGVGPNGADGWVARIGEHDTYCPGDLTGDNAVDLRDLALLLSAFGNSKTGDYDCDCDTDLADLSFLLSNFGDTCP